uniref:Cytochrome b561 domain-containing protein n=1 Tax=Heterorhabditis bacteriophora TaxID=37862 RepID=A0A1I7XB57_HETBA
MLLNWYYQDRSIVNNKLVRPNETLDAVTIYITGSFVDAGALPFLDLHTVNISKRFESEVDSTVQSIGKFARPAAMRRLPLVLLSSFSICAAFSFSECNTTKACWFHPPSCSENKKANCLSGVEWQVVPDGIEIQVCSVLFQFNTVDLFIFIYNISVFQLQTYVNDLDNTRPYYAAVGFSLNQRMDDDTVVECIQPLDGVGLVQVSFNDESYNDVLPQASSVLLENGTTSLVDGLLTCNMKFLLDNRELVSNDTRFMIHDLEARPYYLLFARGNADAWKVIFANVSLDCSNCYDSVTALVKDIHSVNDNPQFPWMSKHMVGSTYKCSSAVGNTSKFLIAYFSSLIPYSPRSNGTGSIESQSYMFHRDLFLISVILQILAVFFIFWQAGWVWFECSYKCTLSDFSKKMHTITGVVATVLAICQPFFAFMRPSPNSQYRYIFNWGHWIIGMVAWSFASAAIVLSLPLGKTGLNMVYGYAPNYVVGGYILFFIGCNVILEMLSTSNEVRMEKSDQLKPHRFIVGPSGMALSHLNGPSAESPVAPPTVSFLFCIPSINYPISSS